MTVINFDPDEELRVAKSEERTINLHTLNGVSKEKYVDIASKMKVDELRRRIRTDEDIIRAVNSIIYWIKVGMGPKATEVLSKYEERNVELFTCKTIKELVLMRKDG